MLPASSDLRALRTRLLERLSALKAYFEATSVSVGLKAPYWGAFDALRRNQPLAEAFVSDLQQLLDLLEREVVPALGQPAPGRSAGPASQALSTHEPDGQIVSSLPAAIQRDLATVRPNSGPGRSPSGKSPTIAASGARGPSERSSTEALPLENSAELIPMQPNAPVATPAPAQVPASRKEPSATAAARIGTSAAGSRPPAKPAIPAMPSPERTLKPETGTLDVAAPERKLANQAPPQRSDSAPLPPADSSLSKRAAALKSATLEVPTAPATKASSATPKAPLPEPQQQATHLPSKAAPLPAAKLITAAKAVSAVQPPPAAAKPAEAAKPAAAGQKPAGGQPLPAVPTVAVAKLTAAPQPAPAPATKPAITAKPVSAATKPATTAAPTPIAPTPQPAAAKPAPAVQSVPAVPTKPAAAAKAAHAPTLPAQLTASRSAAAPAMAKPMAIPGKLPMTGRPAAKPMPEFDQSDVSQPNLSQLDISGILENKK